MKLSDEMQDYLSGKMFDHGITLELKGSSSISYRDEYLIKISQNRKILHLGFVDHIPLIESKIAHKKWLHNKLIEASKFCVGIDTNTEGIQYIRSKYGIKDLYALDIVNDDLPEEVMKTKFDYLLIPDVIEHIGNPVEFLETIKKRFAHNVGAVVITTPNAFRLNNIINAWHHKEIINSDHRFWFSPFTLSKVLNDAGHNIESIQFCEHSRLSRRQILRKWILSKKAFFQDTLIIKTHLK